MLQLRMIVIAWVFNCIGSGENSFGKDHISNVCMEVHHQNQAKCRHQGELSKAILTNYGGGTPWAWNTMGLLCEINSCGDEVIRALAK